MAVLFKLTGSLEWKMSLKKIKRALLSSFTRLCLSAGIDACEV